MAIISVEAFRTVKGVDQSDLMTIRSALAVAKAGDTVQLAGKTYTLDPTGKLESNAAISVKTSGIVFEGAADGKSILKLAPGYAGELTGIIRTDSGTKVDNVHFRNFTVDGSNTAGVVKAFYVGAGIESFTKAHSGIVIEKVTVRNASAYGLDPHNQSENLILKDNLIETNGRNATNYQEAGLTFAGVHDALAINNSARGNIKYGINVVEQSHDIALVGNKVSGNTDFGIVAQYGSFSAKDARPAPDKASTSDVLLHGNDLTSQAKDVRIGEVNAPGGPTLDVLVSQTRAMDTNAIGSQVADIHMLPSVATVPSYAGMALLVDLGGKSSLTGTGAFEVLAGLAGNDVLKGEAGNDVVSGGTGGDTLYGGTGTDVVIGGSGDDAIYGEDGSDTLVGGRVNDKIWDTTAQANSVTSNDLLDGGSGNDDLKGRHGDDTIYGGSGNDTIEGNEGRDIIDGGTGKDTIRGGADPDVFKYNSTSDSGTALTLRDLITDFTPGDKLDLSGIDANILTAGDQAFGSTLRGAGQAFTGAGQLRFANGILEGNVDANTGADFAIQVQNNGVDLKSLLATDITL